MKRGHIAREKVVNLIQDRGFRHYDYSKKSQFFRIPGTTTTVNLPRRNEIPEGRVRGILHFAGYTKLAVEQFITTAR